MDRVKSQVVSDLKEAINSKSLEISEQRCLMSSSRYFCFFFLSVELFGSGISCSITREDSLGQKAGIGILKIKSK